MKKTIRGLCALLLICTKIHAQSAPELAHITQRQAHLQRVSTWTLAGWSVANLTVSGIAIGQAQGSDKYFHQMNL